jgi:hypothetical protein
MPKKKQLTQTQWGLSRLKAKDLPFIGIDGLTDSDEVFGSNPKDIIEYHVYDTSDNYIASGEISEIPTNLDVGAHVRSLGYERGTYKIVYNFLREIGGSNKFVLTKKSNKSIYTGQYMVQPNGRIVASHNLEPDLEVPLLDNKGKEIELFVQEDKFWIQEVSPSRTEIRLRPNPAIDDPDYYEQFRILGYTCLSYSDISGGSEVTLASGVATITGNGVNLNNKMAGGTLKIREAFVIDEDETPEVISRFVPEVENITLPIATNLVTNGHFNDGLDVQERGQSSVRNEIVDDIENPGNSKWILKTASVGTVDMQNKYQLLLKGIPGENYIISCWVHWTPEWTHNKTLFIGGIDSPSGNIFFNDGVAGPTAEREVFETKEINGKLWERYYKVVTIPEDSNGSIDLQFGYTNEETPDGYGERYITNIQIEPGSANGIPTPFMEVERTEEVDVPSTGLITFTDDNKVEASFSEEDSGFTDLMAAGSGGRGSGILTIKDAYVVDEIFTQDTEVTVIDDIPIKNPLATDITKYEREFRVSPYHGGASNKILIRADNYYNVYSVNSAGNQTLIGSSQNQSQSWTYTGKHNIPEDMVSLRIETRENSGGAGLIAKIWYNGTISKTGDGTVDYERNLDDGKYTHYSDIDEEEYGYSYGDDQAQTIVTITNTGTFNLASNSTVPDDTAWVKLNKPVSGVHKDLQDCTWIWASEATNNQDLVWTWALPATATELIWQ